MGYDIAFEGDGEPDVFSFATTGGLAAFARWAEALPAGFDAVKTLAASGEVSGTSALSGQLRSALDDHPPEDGDVEHTARNLLDLTGVGDPGEAARIVGND